ncbi:MAG TPA: hypothetical protein VFG89_10545 [Coriobacteriia bacterium]|nr:hypothetical protein [Coriobacteriia bacterium]
MTPKTAQKTTYSNTPKTRKVTRSKAGYCKECGEPGFHICGSDHVHKIGETRTRLPQMVSSLESGESASYVVGAYGKPSAALVSYARFRPLLEKGSKEERFALLIADELLAEAPPHLWTSAIAELSALPKCDLLELWKLTAASTDSEIKSLRARLRHPDALDRLMLRMRVAQSIGEARDAGLYDAAESMASSALGGSR